MAYASEAEYRAAIVAYRALHDVFYRFHKSVRAQHPESAPTAPRQPVTGDPHVIAANEHDYAAMVGEILPELAQAYAGPREFVERLADTLRRLGEAHAASPKTPFDVRMTHQAYVDVDNIFQDLLGEREQHAKAFDEAFSGAEAERH